MSYFLILTYANAIVINLPTYMYQVFNQHNGTGDKYCGCWGLRILV